MNSLDSFIELNNINKEEIQEALYLDIREIVLKTIIEKLKSEQTIFHNTKKYYFKYSNVEATRKTVKKICDLEMPGEDLKWLDECIRAYMKKKSTRKVIQIEVRKSLYSEQQGRCAICGKSIKENEMHVDHIIPWDYVGDELNDNFQGLCAECNQHKSNHVSIAVSNIILNRRDKK